MSRPAGRPPGCRAVRFPCRRRGAPLLAEVVGRSTMARRSKVAVGPELAQDGRPVQVHADERFLEDSNHLLGDGIRLTTVGRAHAAIQTHQRLFVARHGATGITRWAWSRRDQADGRRRARRRRASASRRLPRPRTVPGVVFVDGSGVPPPRFRTSTSLVPRRRLRRLTYVGGCGAPQATGGNGRSRQTPRSNGVGLRGERVDPEEWGCGEPAKGAGSCLAAGQDPSVALRC